MSIIQSTLVPIDTKVGVYMDGNKIDYGKRGIYDNKNQINDLTGREWKFSSRSVIPKSYPPDMQMQLRKQHGGQKPPKLCAELIKTFSKKGQLVLDPLMGVGGTLLGATLVERKAIGFEINERWINIYKQVCDLEGMEGQETRLGDCRLLMKNLKEKSIDFILTDVPYWNMDKLEKTRSSNSRKTNLSRFNGKGQQTHEEWLGEMKEIFEGCARVLKDKKYMAIFIGDMYRAGKYYMLSSDLAKKISEMEGLVLKANLIWYDVSKALHVYGYPFSFVPSMTHQNILVFRKEY